MDDSIEMYDAFRMPAPSQDSMDWIASQPNLVQWNASQSRCAALESLRQEILEMQQSAPRPSFDHDWHTGFENSPPFLLPASSTTSSASSSSITRRNSRTTTHDDADNTTEATNLLEKMVHSVIVSVEQTELLKRKQLEKQRQKLLASNPKPARQLARARSVRSADQPQKKQPLQRHMSSEGVRTLSTTSSSSTRWSVAGSHDLQSTAAEGSSSRRNLTLAAALSNDPPFETTHKPVRKPYARPVIRVTGTDAPVVRADTAAMPPPPPPARRSPSPPPVLFKSTQPRPSLSQTTHRTPPALGMRRTGTYGAAGYQSSQSSQGLPTKQRGFKPPLARSNQAAPSSSFSRAAVNSTLPQPSSRPRTSASKSPSPSPPPEVDPDSSYPELSFDMDVIEETMRQYD